MEPVKTQILFDGNCIVCDSEVNHYKRLAPELFDIIDITNPQFKAQAFGLDEKSVNIHLHVITPDKKIKVGVEAFAHIWDRLDRYRWANRLILLPFILPAAKLGYHIFATYIRPRLPKKNRIKK